MPVHQQQLVAPSTESEQHAAHLPELRWIRPYLNAAYQALPDASLWRALQEHLRTHLGGNVEQALRSLGHLIAQAHPQARRTAPESNGAVVVLDAQQPDDNRTFEAQSNELQEEWQQQRNAWQQQGQWQQNQASWAEQDWQQNQQRPWNPQQNWQQGQWQQNQNLSQPQGWQQSNWQRPDQYQSDWQRQNQNNWQQQNWQQHAQADWQQQNRNQPHWAQQNHQPRNHRVLGQELGADGGLGTLCAGNTQQLVAQALIPLWLQRFGLTPNREQRTFSLAVLNAYRHLVDQAYLDALSYEQDPQVQQRQDQQAQGALSHILRRAQHTPNQNADACEALRRLLNQKDRGHARFQAVVDQTTAYPFSAVCQLRIRHQHGYELATGFYVAQDRILTSASALHHPRSGWASEVIVTPGRQSLMQRPYASYSVDREAIEIHPDWERSRHSAQHDLAVLKVRTAPPQTRALELHLGNEQVERSIAVCGYTVGDEDRHDHNRQVLAADRLEQLDNHTLRYNEETGTDMRGAPVLTVQNGRIQVLGIQGRQGGQACRINREKAAWIRRLQQHDNHDTPEPRSALDPQEVNRQPHQRHRRNQRRPHQHQHQHQGQLSGRDNVLEDFDFQPRSNTTLSVNAPEGLDALAELGVFEQGRAGSFLRLIKGGEDA